MKSPSVAAAPTARPCWMIVDDDQNILSLMSSVIATFADVELRCFYSPPVALAAFSAAPEAFDFVITDLEMPGMNGMELGKRLRHSCPAIKMLLVTGCGLVTETEAVQRGFCGLLPKPFALETLHAALTGAGLLAGPAKNYFESFASLTPAKGCLA